MLSASEKATLNFYRWEYQYRGYYHFDTPINIEVPYTPFRHITHSNSVKDDGRVPSLFKQFTKLITQKEEEAQEEKVEKLEPHFLSFEEKPNLAGISIVFPKDTEILPNRNIEFINMLSFSEDLISFEIIGSSEEIKIQIVCSDKDIHRVQSHFKAYFPSVNIRNIEINDFGFSSNRNIAIADFGLNDEFMRTISITDSFTIDPLTSVIAIMESLSSSDIVVFQVLFKGITAPLTKDISYSVSDGAGGSFFDDAPEMLVCAKSKIANPLFYVVMRIATQGENNQRSQYLAKELARNITTISQSEYNLLIPLSNEGYNYDFHKYNLHHRLSNRLGFVVNSNELNTFVHYPNKTVVSDKLGVGNDKTKRQSSVSNKGIYLGENLHHGESFQVYFDTKTRLSHTHIIGATGVGKSTLIANMMLADINQGRGCAIFDPHGDICDDILDRIPANRKDDVVIIDPSDSEFPIGFNILQATTDAEKIVLSSDLVFAFKRHATAWGDNMTAVLQNAVNTFLDSSQAGTLIELKRFLIEKSFRENYLQSVQEPSLHYYWEQEYPMVRKGIAPLLTRIDTFLRPKLVRYMLAQKTGIDISKCLNENKIVLLKLSQGLIGEQNSYLLGSLFLAKFNQSALARQSQSKQERTPYMLYLDEFQNFITPSIERILSGARKYGLGLTIAHQELGQIQDISLQNSVFSNPKTRICFRLGDNDAKRLENGFSYFEQNDLQSLERGQAIMRIGSNTNDFNLTTNPLSEINAKNSSLTKQSIIENTRTQYGKPRAEVEEILLSLLPKISNSKQETKPKKEEIVAEKVIEEKPISVEKITIEKPIEEKVKEPVADTDKEQLIQKSKEQEELRKHRSIQNYVRTMAHQRGFKVVLEEELSDGKRVDVGLTKNDMRIAIEISVTNTNDYEVQNIQKCIENKFNYIFMISDSERHLKNIQTKTFEVINKKHHNRIFFVASDNFVEILDSLITEKQTTEKQIKGYRVKTNYSPKSYTKDSQNTIGKIILNSLRKKK